MPAESKKQSIMRAAEKLFTTRRIHEITLDDVIRTARVGKGTVYRYFKNKDDLFLQTAASGFDYLHELLQSQVPDNVPFEKQLLAACRQITDFFDRRRQLFRMMQAESGRMQWHRGQFRRQWIERRRKLTAAVAEIIRRGLDEGKVRSDLPAEFLASILLGMLRTRAGDLEDMPEHLRQHEVIIELFCNGAAAKEPSGAQQKRNRRT